MSDSHMCIYMCVFRDQHVNSPHTAVNQKDPEPPPIKSHMQTCSCIMPSHGFHTSTKSVVYVWSQFSECFFCTSVYVVILHFNPVMTNPPPGTDDWWEKCPFMSASAGCKLLVSKVKSRVSPRVCVCCGKHNAAMPDPLHRGSEVLQRTLGVFVCPVSGVPVHPQCDGWAWHQWWWIHFRSGGANQCVRV